MTSISKKESSDIQFTEWLKEMMRIKEPRHKAIDVIRAACEEHQDEIVYTIVNVLGSTNKYFINEVASIAVEFGREKLFDFMLENGANDWDNFAKVALRENCIILFYNILGKTPTPNYLAIFCAAASHDHLAILKQIIDLEQDNNMSLIASTAIEHSRLDIASFMIDMGANDWNQMANAAALIGNRELLDQMVERGADDFYKIASSAARGGHKEIYDDMISMADEITEYQWDELISDSMEGANREILFSIIDNVDIDLSYLASLAAEEGDIALLNNLIERGVDFWSNVSEFIIRGGREILDEAIRRGYNDWNGLAIQALYSEDIPLFYEMLGRGANNFGKMIEVYSSSGNKEVIKVILDRNEDLTGEPHFSVHEDARIYFNR